MNPGQSLNLAVFCLFATFSFQQSLSPSENANRLIAQVQESIAKADKESSKLTAEILQMEGMSSSKVRHLLNHLCSMPKTRYLEIGCWKGSTWVSALYGNANTIEEAVAIDDWSKLKGPAQTFLSNCQKFLQGIKYRTYSADCFKLSPKGIINQPVNIYFYDGDHSEWSLERALTHYDDMLSDEFILVISNWNLPQVQLGIYRGMAKLRYCPLDYVELPAFFDGDTANWWNGMYIAVISKTRD